MFVTNPRLNTNAFSVVNAQTGLKRPHSLLLPLSSPSLPPPLFSNSDRESWRTARVRDRTVHTRTYHAAQLHTDLHMLPLRWLSAPLSLPANRRQGRSTSQPIALLTLSTSSHSRYTILELKQEQKCSPRMEIIYDYFSCSPCTRVYYFRVPCAGFCLSKWWGTWLMLNLPVHHWDETSVDHEEGSIGQLKIHSVYPDTRKGTWTPV